MPKSDTLAQDQTPLDELPRTPRSQTSITEAEYQSTSHRNEVFFSICIPQYSRYKHLHVQLQRLLEQTCQDFELCISDDLSPEREWAQMESWLENSRLKYVYKVQPMNLRYDANLRAAMSLASGTYILLMGNDDRLADRGTLLNLKQQLQTNKLPEVAITNYRELGSNRVFRRVVNNGQIISGLNAALRSYKNYSFVSGIIFRREEAQRHSTHRWDGSEMYQMGLATQIVAQGGRLLGLSAVMVEKDIEIPGHPVDSYVGTTKETVPWTAWWKGERRLPLARYAATAWDAMSGSCPSTQRSAVAFSIVKQTLTTTYPYWILEYKRISGLHRAVGIAFGMRPRFLLDGLPSDWRLRLGVRACYALMTLIALLTPVLLFKWLESSLHARAKSATWNNV